MSNPFSRGVINLIPNYRSDFHPPWEFSLIYIYIWIEVYANEDVDLFGAGGGGARDEMMEEIGMRTYWWVGGGDSGSAIGR